MDKALATWCKDVSSNPQNPQGKEQELVVQACGFSRPVKRRKVETEKPQKLVGQVIRHARLQTVHPASLRGTGSPDTLE